MATAPLKDVQPLPEDVIDTTRALRPAPSTPERLATMGAPGEPATESATYEQDASGRFRRVDRRRGRGSGTAVPTSSPPRRAAGEVGSGSSGLPAAPAEAPASSGLGQSSGGRSILEVEDVAPVPESFELRFASFITNIVLASGAFAPGLLAGAALFEVSVLAHIGSNDEAGDALEREPISPVGIYFAANLHLFRLMLWGSVVSCVAICLRYFASGRSSHYVLQPWRKLLDVALGLCYLILVWLTFALRQNEFSFASPSCRECAAGGPVLADGAGSVAAGSCTMSS